MIKNEIELRSAKKALQNVENALLALRRRVYDTNREMFTLMAQDYVKTIRDLRSNIDAYLGVSEVVESSVPIWVRAEGADIQLWNTPSSVWYSILHKIKNAVSNVNKILLLEPKDYNPAVADLRVVAVQSGSLKIGLDLPKINRRKNISLRDLQSVNTAVEKMFSAMSWLSNKEVVLTPLDLFFVDTQQRNRVLSEISNLIPPKDEIELIEFGGGFLQGEKPIKLVHSDKQIISKVIEKTETDVEKEIEGVIRELDLDRTKCILRGSHESHFKVKCVVNRNIINEVCGAFNKRVRVSGVFKKGKEPFTIRSIRVLK